MMSSWKSKDGRLGRVFLVLMLLGLFSAQIGCGPGLTTPKESYLAPEAAAGGGSTPAAPPSGPVVDSEGFFLAIAGPSHVVDRAYLHRAQNAGAAMSYDDWQSGIMPDTTGLTEECAIPLGTTAASANYLCVLEIEELDLYFNPIDIQVHIPSSSCEYYRIYPYSFWAWEPGAGPTVASYDRYEDGTIVNPVNVDGSGNIQCNYDHTSSNGPNCCHGSYVLTVRSETDNNGTAGDGPLSTSTTTGDHEGAETNCLAGQGVSNTNAAADWGQKTTGGYPVPATAEISGTGINTTKTLPRTNLQTSPTQATSNLWISNYINPTAAPYAMTKASDKVAYYTPNIAYRVECLDAAQDLLGRIGLLIREWDEGISSGGDPDSGYGGAYEPPPYDTDFINDRYDWNDVVNFWGLSYPETDL